MFDFIKRRFGGVAFAIGVATLCAVSLTSYEQIGRAAEAEEWVAHTQRVIDHLHQAFADIACAEANARDFILTGNNDDAIAYRSYKAETRAELKLLLQLTADNPPQMRRIALYTDMIAQRLGQFDSLIAWYLRIGRQGAVVHPLQMQPNNMIEEYRAAAETMVSAEQQLLKQRLADMAEQKRRVHLEIWAGDLLAALLIMAGVWAAFRQTGARRRAERKHDASERRFRLMVENTTDYAFLMLDVHGNVIRWNPGAERIKGYREEEILGQHFSIFYPPQDAAAGRPAEVLRITAEKGKYAEEGWRVRKDGQWFWAGITIIALRDENGTVTGFAKITHDLSAHKAFEDALRQANDTLEARVAERAAQWKAAFETGPIPMALFDLEGNWIEANAKWCQMVGYAEEELKGMNLRAVSLPEEVAEGERNMQKLLAGELETYTRDKTIKRKDNGTVLTQTTVNLVRDRENRPLYMIGAFLDITERKRADEALRASEAKFRATVEHAPLGITHIGLDGTVLLVNQALCDMLGYGMEELMAMRPEQVIYPEDIGSDIEGTRLLLSGDVTVYRRHKRHFRKDGSICWTNISNTLMRDDTCSPMYFAALVEDITERKRVEEALAQSIQELEQSEQRFKSLFDHNPDAVFSLDLEGRFVTANLSVTRISGYTEEELRGQSFVPLVAPADLERTLAHFQAIREGQPQRCEIVVIRRDGTEIEVDITGVPMIVGGRVAGAHVIAADISDRKRAERQLQAAMRENQNLFEHSLDIICAVDASGRFTRISPAAERVLGYSLEEMAGQSCLGFIHPDDREATRQRVADCSRNGSELADCENRYVRKDGKLVHIRWACRWSPIDQVLVCVGRDVTEAKQAERALMNSERRYRATYENAPIGIAHADFDGHWTRVNQKLCDILGYSSDELLGMTCHQITHPDDVARQRAEIQRLQSGEIGSFRMEKRYFHKAGDIVWTDFTGATVEGEGGEPGYIVAVVEDITDRKRMEQELKEAEKKLRLIVDGATDYAMMTLDNEGRITTWSEGACRITGYGENEAVGRHFEMLFVEEDMAASVPKAELDAACRDGYVRDERWQARKDGSRYFATGTTMALNGAAGRVKSFVKVFQDTTARRQVEEENLYLANHDPLTSLPNRTCFSNRLHDALVFANRSRQHVALLLLDLDRFKSINDTMGHHVGDLLLKEVAARLQACVRETDTVARLGGDEFVIIQTQLTQPDAAGVLAKKVVDELARPFWLEGQRIHSGASVGVTLYPDDAGDPVDLMKSADMAMYKAKARGRHNHQFYTDDLRAEAHTRKSLELSLRRAVEDRRFFLLYQPQIDLQTWQMTGVEALLRWDHPEQIVVTPDRFISLAEETGLIVPIGEWVLRAACEQGRAWQLAGMPQFRTAVNVSARQLQDPRFLKVVEQVLDETGYDPAALEIEITEGLLLENVPGNNAILANLKAMGVKVAVDDFGTGFSALSYLKNFPVDVLKIDRSFTRHLPHNRQDTVIAASIIGLADGLGIKVVAEGVESAEQLTYLKNHNCSTAQGFYFSPPIDAMALSNMLRNGVWSSRNPVAGFHRGGSRA